MQDLTETLVAEIIEEELQRERDRNNRPTTLQMKKAMRTILDTDPHLEDAILAAGTYRPLTIENAKTRIKAIVEQVAALPQKLVPTIVIQTITRHNRLKQQGETEIDGQAISDILETERQIVAAMTETAKPRPNGPLPVGASVITIEQPSNTVPIPIGTPGTITAWEEGFAVVAFQTPFVDTNGTTWEYDEDYPTIKFRFRNYHLQRAVNEINESRNR